jgi:UDP-N-acetylmuramoylalanine--D-glutamate ligase
LIDREMSDANWNGRNILVLGLGDTGLSALRWLARKGARVRAADTRAAPPALGAVRAQYPALAVALGAFEPRLLEGVDAIVASPGLALRDPFLREAARRGLEILGDVEVFAREVESLRERPRLIGVTGTNGKSTVTALAAAMGSAAGLRSRAIGNIGVPVLDALAEAERDGMPQVLAIELSSYQLETTASLRLDAATMLNLTQDHLDRYDSLDDYARAKARIFAHCRTRVLNRDDAYSRAMAGGETWTFGLDAPRDATQWGVDRARGVMRRGDEDILPVAQMAMPGLHNVANGLAAHALGSAIGLAKPAMARALREFRGLPHRVQPVAEARGVRFYDDSKGTNVGAAVAALEGFDVPVVLIAGGDGKQQDFAPLAPAVKAHARAVVLIGRDGATIGGALASTGVTLRSAATMEDAVAAAFELARPGDAVLLSPACASFDMFRNYGHRGDVFAEAARALARAQAH